MGEQKVGNDDLVLSRRAVLKGGAVVGAAAGTAALAARPQPATAQGNGLVRAGTSNREPLSVDSPMSRWKKPPSLEFIEGAISRFSFPNWQSGNDDSVWYNMKRPAD